MNSILNSTIANKVLKSIHAITFSLILIIYNNQITISYKSLPKSVPNRLYN